jgi:predicted MFS family arabinose efflux permease
MTGGPGEGIPARVVVVFAVACGAVVANLYYAQPLLATMARGLRVSDATAGLVVTLSQLGYAAGLLLVVPLGDVLERRRLVTVLLGVAAVGLVVVAASPDLAVLGAAILVVGLSSVVAQVLVPFAATLARDDQRGRVVGQIMSGLLLGILLARTVAGALGQLLGWRAVYLVAAGVVVALVVLLRIEMPAAAPSTGLRYRSLLASVGRLVAAEPVLRLRCALGALTFAAFSVFWTTMAFLLSGAPYHYNEVVIGLFGLAGAAGALAAGRAGRLADRGLARLTTPGFGALIAVSYAACAAGRHSLGWLIVGVVVLDLGVQGLHVTNQSEIYRLAPEARSRVTTAYMVSYFAGGAAGSALASALYSAAGWTGVCELGAGLGLAAFGLGALSARWSATTPPARSRHATEDHPVVETSRANPA